ncbi:MAG TPA: dihydrolipoamide acetyltransferase family protein [Mucilaginibacter sp.]|jgi:2-oxoglutarate dehydrogenase E2 component (dihydrolipoamide succinyltransferase)
MAKYKLLLPKMGESVAEATIIRWSKNPGDYIKADETVMEIATDKVDSDVPSPVAGKLTEQLYKENDIVQVGSVIAVIETDEPEEIAAPPVAAPVQRPVAEEPVTYEVHQPAEELNQPSTETNEPVAEEPKHEPVAETPGPEARELNEIKQPIFSEQRQELAQPVPFVNQLEYENAAKTEDAHKGSSRFYSPLVKNIAAQEGISNTELDQIPGTGAEGRLTKDDLLNYIRNKDQSAAALQGRAAPATEAPAKETFEQSQISGISARGQEPVTETPLAEAQPGGEISHAGQVAQEPKPQAQSEKPGPAASTVPMPGGDEIIEMDRMRRLIADHMVMSKHTSPHVTSFVEADVTNLVLWRDKVKNSFEKREGEKITFTPIFIEAVVRAIKDLPMINIQVNGTQIIKKKDINISMAIALPSGNLIVPVIKRADELSLLGITKAVNDLANRARNNKLKPDDIQGGTFTVTNVGSFGNVMGTPIINQPQAAILAVGVIRKKPAVVETLQGDMIGIRHMMFLSLSYDHRVVDGALGGSFVRRVADYLENWDPGREI